MKLPDRSTLESRLLVLAPTGRDAPMARHVLEGSGIEVRICANASALAVELGQGAGALLVAEEALSNGGQQPLLEALSAQPSWSDLPLVLLTLSGADSATAGHVLAAYGNVTLLERPVRVSALISTVRAALRSRSRQYELRADLEERERVAQRLKEADRRKDEFLAMLAHELRNPLAPIRNSLHILRLTSGQNPAAQRLGEMMERQVNHMVRLVDDLLEVSRITRGKIELRPERVELSAVLEHAVETSRPLIEAGGHRLTVTLPDDSLTLKGDPVRLAQVFANLLNNAAKFMDAGGQIWLTARRQDQAVVVSVRDQGLGIPPELLPRVFDMFTQGDRTAGRPRGGLGIGLTLVKSLIELHGGKVHAHSAGKGRGSEFVVTLPLFRGPASDPTDRLEARPARLTLIRRVLVVDDNRDAADSLALLLHLMSIDVHVVYDGLEALEAVGSYRPAVVLLDLGMPGIDGWEVARRIRQRPELSAIKLVALTGWGQEEDLLRSRAAGFDAHLVKPVEATALEALLGSWEAVEPERSITP